MASRAITTDVRVEGLRDLEEMLIRHLPAAAGYKVMRASMFKASLPVVKAAKANAPMQTGALAVSIGRFVKRGKEGDRVLTLFIGPKVKSKKALALARAGGREINGIFYGHMVERGTRTMGANPFLRPAMDANKVSVPQSFGVEMRTAIEKAVVKHRRRG